MLKSPVAWAIALWIGLLIHGDWHLGRPGHDHLSFALPYHWILALVTFAPLPWTVARRWPRTFGAASVFVLGLGVVLGQGLEPLGEVVAGRSTEPLTNPVRWRVFAEFMAAGVLVYLAVARLVLRRSRRAAA
jgi:hypothetical protein